MRRARALALVAATALLLVAMALALPACSAPAAGPEPARAGPVDLFREAASMSFATRQLLRAFRWGQQPGELPRTRAGSGGFDDDSAPAEILHATERRFWLRDPNGGSLFVVDTASGATAAVELRAGLSELWQRTLVYTYGMAQAADGGVVVLAAARPPGADKFRYFVRRFDLSGAPRGEGLPLDAAAWPRDTPRRFAEGPDGTLWVGLANETVVLDTNGQVLARIPATGVLLASGLFLSDGTPARLHDRQGGTAGMVTPVPDDREPPQWLARGPADVLLAPVAAPSSIPQAARAALELYEVRQLALPERKLFTIDLVAVPARRLQPLRAGAPDATPLRSYFPPRGMAFTKEGDLVQLELTDAECRIYLLRRLKAEEDWTHKFADVRDASRAELELLRAEYLMRSGQAVDASSYSGLFSGMAWRVQQGSSARPRHQGSADDPILQRLQPSAPARNSDRE